MIPAVPWRFPTMLKEELEKCCLSAAAWYTRTLPKSVGRWRILKWLRPRVRRVFDSETSVVLRTHYGFKMRLNLADWIGQELYISGAYEPATSALLGRLVLPGDTVVDIGANIGYFTLLAAQAVGSCGKVHAFEPVPQTRRALEDNLRLNRMHNVVVWAEALANRVGETVFYQGPANHIGLSSLRPLEEYSRTLQVRTALLDNFLSPDEEIRLVKIDVEGAEAQVLEGMSACIDRWGPDLIIEVTDEYLRPMGTSAETLCLSLLNRGYRMFLINDEGLQPLSSWRAGLPAQFNALFTARDMPPSLDGS